MSIDKTTVEIIGIIKIIYIKKEKKIAHKIFHQLIFLDS